VWVGVAHVSRRRERSDAGKKKRRRNSLFEPVSQLGTLLHENGYKLERTRCLNKEGPPPRLHVVGESEGDGVTLSLIGQRHVIEVGTEKVFVRLLSLPECRSSNRENVAAAAVDGAELNGDEICSHVNPAECASNFRHQLRSDRRFLLHESQIENCAKYGRSVGGPNCFRESD
jgi:hypothetical protein